MTKDTVRAAGNLEPRLNMLGHFKQWTALGLLLATTAVCGCQALCGPQGIPDDPLYFGKKPKASPAISAAPANLAPTEPVMPSEPAAKTRGALVNRVNSQRDASLGPVAKPALGLGQLGSV